MLSKPADQRLAGGQDIRVDTLPCGLLPRLRTARAVHMFLDSEQVASAGIMLGKELLTRVKPSRYCKLHQESCGPSSCMLASKALSVTTSVGLRVRQEVNARSANGSP